MSLADEYLMNLHSMTRFLAATLRNQRPTVRGQNRTETSKRGKLLGPLFSQWGVNPVYCCVTAQSKSRANYVVLIPTCTSSMQMEPLITNAGSVTTYRFARKSSE